MRKIIVGPQNGLLSFCIVSLRGPTEYHDRLFKKKQAKEWQYKGKNKGKNKEEKEGKKGAKEINKEKNESPRRAYFFGNLDFKCKIFKNNSQSKFFQ